MKSVCCIKLIKRSSFRGGFTLPILASPLFLINTFLFITGWQLPAIYITGPSLFQQRAFIALQLLAWTFLSSFKYQIRFGKGNNICVKSILLLNSNDKLPEILIDSVHSFPKMCQNISNKNDSISGIWE